MSLAGLFALSLETKSLQTASPSPQGEGEGLKGLAFLNELATLLANHGKPGSLSEEEAALKGLESEASGQAGQGAGIVNPPPSPDQAQSLAGLGGSLAPEAKAVSASASDASGDAASEKAVKGDAGASQAGRKADLPAFQEASAAQPSKALDGGRGSRVPPATEQLKGEASLQEPTASSAGAKSTPVPPGRPIEGFQQRDALARPFEPDNKVPPHLVRSVQGSQQPSGQSISVSSLNAAFASQTAHLAALRPAADKPGRPLSTDAQLSSAALRPSSERAPGVEAEPIAKEGGESDPSRQRHAALRSGASFANGAASSQSASSGLRFADSMQSQPNSAQPGLPASEAPAAKALPTLAGESLQGEPATVRGQEADQVFSQVVQNARLLRSQGETRFEVRLKPDFLGRIRIESQISADQKMTTRFLVEDAEVRALLESRLPLLAERLGESGVRMTSLEVHSMNSQSGGDSSRSAGEAGEQARRQQGSAGRDGSSSQSPGSKDEDPHPHRWPGEGPGRIHLVA